MLELRLGFRSRVYSKMQLLSFDFVVAPSAMIGCMSSGSLEVFWKLRYVAYVAGPKLNLRRYRFKGYTINFIFRKHFPTLQYLIG